jgi:D-3-phosphoglycerate dehydrogenase / 2-oxoglutarate reductase
MKVLIADKFEKAGVEGLQDLGCEVAYEPDLKGDTLVDALVRTGADVLIVRSTKVTEPMLDVGRLSLVVRAGAGYDNIDVQAASARGIYVANCPGKNSVAVAELAFGLILALDRRIPDNVADLRAGTWNKKEYSKARGLHGRTLGVLGFGNIGQEMARRAQAFGMHLAIWSEMGVEVDRSGTPIDMPLLVRLRPSSGYPVEPFAEVCQTPEELAEKSDILSVHVGLNDRTRGLVSASVLERLRPGSFFVNTARGEIVDYEALAKVVKERNIRVALDVYAAEPATPTASFTDPLVALPNVYGTHHIGASTDQAQEAIAEETVRIVKSYRETGRAPNVVNLSRRTPATHVLVVRHRDRPGVLATVFDVLRDAKVNVQETENIVFSGAEAAVARINLDALPSDDLLDRIRSSNPNVLDVAVVPLSAAAASHQLAKSQSTW